MSDSITFLGTSDGLPSADRHHASVLLRLAGQTILLDCGEPCSHTLKRLGVDFNSIDAIFVSHTHSDHVGGLPMLLQSMWLEGRTRPLPLWLPRRVIRPLRNWLHACFLFDPLFKFRIQWRGLSEKSPACVGKVRIRSFRTTHLDATRAVFARKYPAVGFDAFCFLIEAAGKRVAYSGDIGKPQDLEPLLTEAPDVLIVELAHCDADSIFQFLNAREVRHVVFTHLGRATRAKRGNLRSRRVSFVADGDVIKF